MSDSALRANESDVASDNRFGHTVDAVASDREYTATGTELASDVKAGTAEKVLTNRANRGDTEGTVVSGIDNVSNVRGMASGREDTDNDVSVASGNSGTGSVSGLANAVPDIELRRRVFGLSRSQTWELLLLGRPLWLQAGGDGPDYAVENEYTRSRMFAMWNGDVPVPAWVQLGVEWLSDAYTDWKAGVLAEVREAGDTPGKLSTYELSRVLGMTDYYVYELRFNGTLSYTGKEGRAFTYTVKDVEKLFATCECWISEGRPVAPRLRGRMHKMGRSVLGGNNSPLSRPFMRVVKRQIRNALLHADAVPA